MSAEQGKYISPNGENIRNCPVLAGDLPTERNPTPGKIGMPFCPTFLSCIKNTEPKMLFIRNLVLRKQFVVQ